MPNKYHDEMVWVTDEIGDKELVFRYLRKCKHCVGWYGGDDRAGPCSRLSTMTYRERTTCDKMLATEVGINQMWIETEARIGDEYVRIQYEGRTYFVERDKLVDMIGLDEANKRRGAT